MTLVEKICAPLFNSTAVSFFSFTTYYKNKKILNLNTNQRWFQHCWAQHYIQKHAAHLVAGFNYWTSDSVTQAMIQDSEKMFNIGWFVEYVSQHNNWINSFCYGGSKQSVSNIINLIINNTSVLRSFNTIFLSTLDGVIKSLSSDTNNLLSIQTNVTVRPNPHFSFETSPLTQRLLFNNGENDIIITPQQANILALKLRGHTNKTIAQVLKTSINNIENRMNSIKKKFPLNKGETLITKCLELGIYDDLEHIYQYHLRKIKNLEEK